MMVFQAHSACPLGLAYAPDGRTLATAGMDGAIVFSDLTRYDDTGPHPRVTIEEAHGTEEGSGDPHNVTHLDFTPDGSRVVSAGDGGTVRVWDARDGRLTHTFRQLPGESEYIGVLAVSPDGTRVAWAGSSFGWQPAVVTRRLDKPRARPVCARGHSNAVGMIVSSDPYLATGSADRAVKFWRWGEERSFGEFRGRGIIRGMAVTRDGTRIGASSGRSISLRSVDPETGRTGRPVALIGHTRTVNSVAFTPRYDRIVSTADDGTLRIWEVESGQLVRTFSLGLGPLHGVAASSDGTTIAFSARKGLVGMIDAD